VLAQYQPGNSTAGWQHANLKVSLLLAFLCAGPWLITLFASVHLHVVIRSTISAEELHCTARLDFTAAACLGVCTETAPTSVLIIKSIEVWYSEADGINCNGSCSTLL
jgi:hypothetical protein